MNAIKRNIPNALTCMNLACGCIGIISLLNGDAKWAVYSMFIAAIFDFFDGFVARVLKVTSPIGKDLDSLADVVTFGVLPGIMMYHLIKYSLTRKYIYELTLNFHDVIISLSYIGLLIPIFSAIRLAKFNNDPEQRFDFKGLPTPANGLVIGSTYYWLTSKLPASPLIPGSMEIKKIAELIMNPFVLTSITLLLSFLLVSKIKLLAFKFKGFGWKDNKWKYILLILCLPLIIWLKFGSAPIILVLYIIISQIHFRTVKHEI